MKKTFLIVTRIIFIPLELLAAFLFALLIYVFFSSTVSAPEVPSINIGKREQVAENHFRLGNNYLKKNDFGIWEMYVEGEPYERGLIYGELAKELNQQQEEIFVAQINQWVPKGFFQNMLKILMGFATNEIPNHINLENQQEIYGISQTFSDEFDYIAPKYTRILGYHAAHDMGHALNDYSVVGCSSFSIKGTRTTTNNLIIGRNFDFYVGDEFAENKIIWMVNPSTGYKFISYTWAGFTGVASGMNEQGITVTINASKSDIPKSSKTPIALLAREILQYSKNIDEAIAIAKKHQTFVSESIMVGSANDNKTIIIEKSPTQQDVYEVNGDELICTNHYQSPLFAKEKINLENIKSSDSNLRFERLKELLSAHSSPLSPENVATILRDQHGNKGDTLGIGNPRALNQLLAHHSVIMLPKELQFYVTTKDYQLGKYIAFDLKKSFEQKKAVLSDIIEEDPFIASTDYAGYKLFRQTKKEISDYIMFDKPLNLTQDEIELFISQNSASYVTYETLGRYFTKKGRYEDAKFYYKIALEKNVASPAVAEQLRKAMANCGKD